MDAEELKEQFTPQTHEPSSPTDDVVVRTAVEGFEDGEEADDMTDGSPPPPPTVDKSEFDPKRIFVGRLVKGMSASHLQDIVERHFSSFGVVERIVLPVDSHTGLPKGFSFITFTESAAVELVLSCPHVIDEVEVDCKPAFPRNSTKTLYDLASVPGTLFKTRKIFVAGLPQFVTDNELVSHYSRFGSVASARVIKDKRSGHSKGFGFVEFSSEAAVDKAMSNFASHYLGGKWVMSKRASMTPPRTSNMASLMEPAVRAAVLRAIATSPRNYRRNSPPRRGYYNSPPRRSYYSSRRESQCNSPPCQCCHDRGRRHYSRDEDMYRRRHDSPSSSRRRGGPYEDHHRDMSHHRNDMRDMRDGRDPRDGHRDPRDMRGDFRDDHREMRGMRGDPREDHREMRGDPREMRSDHREMRGDPRDDHRDMRGDPRDDHRDMRSDMRSDSRDMRSDLRNDIRGDLREMRSDVRDLRSDSREMRSDLRDLRGDPRDIRGDPRDDHRDMRDDSRDMRSDPRDDHRDLRDEHRTDLRGDPRDDHRDLRGDPREDHHLDHHRERDDHRPAN